jgi:2-hydroxychromene-2-carboxylate isomerase
MGRKVLSKTLEFIFDFASPNAYLVMDHARELARRQGAEFIITPCLLGGIFRSTGNKAPFVRYADAPSKMAYEQLEMRRYIAKHGLTKFRMNPAFPINTLLLMRIAVAAEMDGKLHDFINVANRGMWEDGLDLGDESVIKKLLDDNGFDGASLIARAGEEAVKAKLVISTQKAVERGVFGIPSFFVGDELFFGKERLGQVEEALAAA